MSFNKILFCLSFLLLSLDSNGQTPNKHEVVAGETLYSLSKRYNTTVDAIKKANGMTTDNIKAGQVLTLPSVATSSPSNSTVIENNPIKSVPSINTVDSKSEPTTSVKVIEVQIPKCKLTYIPEKKTTVAEVCAKFGISESEFLSSNPDIRKSKIKKGTSLCIPYTESERSALIRAEAEAIQQREAEEKARREREAAAAAAAAAAEARANQLDNIKVAVVLPFELSQERKSQEAIKMIDFYEGMLLAIDDLNSKGVDVELQVYDEAETPIDSILTQLSSSPCHIIIGSKDLNNITSLRSYSRRNKILMAVPFSSKEDLTIGYPDLFQVNMKSTLLYDKVYEQFSKENRDSHVVFVTCPRTDDNHYINGFQTYLSEHNISHSSVMIDDMSTIEALARSGKRVVLIPTDKSPDSFKTIIGVLDGYESQVSSRISLFGYPEWQTFSLENTNKLRLYHCSFYTTFYANLTSEEVLKFTSRFKSKFNRDQYNSRPLYGLLGYDVTKFFLGGLHEYGKTFSNHQQSINVNALQNPMLFERNYTSQNNGFINKNIRIIHP